MKRYKKTYAIFHLTEKHTVFYLGKTKVHVSFTGGIVTKKGVTPATFTTDDPIVQLAIENSEDFKKGAIKLRSKYPVQGEIKVGKNPPKEQSPASDVIPDAVPEQTSSCESMDETVRKEVEFSAETVSETGAEDVIADQEESMLKPDIPVIEETGEEKQAEGDNEIELEVVDASCKDVAKQYLQEHFGESPSPLRTREDVQRCAAKYGIRFNFI